MKSIKSVVHAVLFAAVFFAASAANAQFYGGGYGYTPLPTQWGGNTSAGQYGANQSLRTENVQIGKVLAIRQVVLEPSKAPAAGGALGGVVGGIAGNQVGEGTGKLLATIAGTVVGGLVGSDVASDAYREEGVVVTVRLEPTHPSAPGRVIAVTQRNDQPLQVGMDVQVIGGGYNSPTRVLPL